MDSLSIEDLYDDTHGMNDEEKIDHTNIIEIDDYELEMEKSKLFLQSLKWNNPGRKPISEMLTLEQRDEIVNYSTLTAAATSGTSSRSNNNNDNNNNNNNNNNNGRRKKQFHENGYCMFNDGTGTIACHVSLPNCTGKMYEWWFSFVDSTDKYKIWHPYDHVSGYWNSEYYQEHPQHRVIGKHHIGQSHIVDEYVGGQLQELHIDFLDPSDYFKDIEQMKANGITACIFGRIHIRTEPMIGDVAVGYLLHTVRDLDDGSGAELRSRFWIGHVEKTKVGYAGWLPKWFVDKIGNTRFFRYFKVSPQMLTDIHKHCFEEMSVLGHILPDLYKKYSGETK